MILQAFTRDIDLTQIVFAIFALFFLGLVIYLRREDKREGYPLEDPQPGGRPLVGFPEPPPPKVYNLMEGGAAQMPHDDVPSELKARPLFPFPGPPLVPTGNPMLDGVGPGAWCLRKEEPLLMKTEKEPQIIPLRESGHWRVVKGDPDPRGMSVRGADGKLVGTVVDLWVDRSVKFLRYLEVEVTVTPQARRALLPIYYANVKSSRRLIKVSAILASQFAEVPRLREPDRVTAREEDQINAYYAGGLLYATPRRVEPVL